jgi:hypothetical protein
LRSRAAALPVGNGQKGGRPKGPSRQRAPRKRPPKTDSLTESESDSVSNKGGSVVPETDSLCDSTATC